MRSTPIHSKDLSANATSKEPLSPAPQTATLPMCVPMDFTSISRALLVSSLLSALVLASCTKTPDPNHEAEHDPNANAHLTAPLWVPSTSSPTYTLALPKTPNDTPKLLDAKGDLWLDLGASFSARYGASSGAANCQASSSCLHDDTLALSNWTHTARDDGSHTLTASVSTAVSTLEVTYTLETGRPVLSMRTTITWNEDVYPDREALTFTLQDQAASLARDMRFARLSPGQSTHSDRWTPHRIVTGEGPRAMHIQGHGWDGLEVHSKGGHPTLSFELDDARNHPFVSVDGCESEHPTNQHHDRLQRSKGESKTSEIHFWLGHTWAPIVHRYPSGFEAAVALIDSSPTTHSKALAATLWGHSNTTDPRFGNGGFLGNNLPLTVSLPPGPQGATHPDISALTRRAQPHSVRFAHTRHPLHNPPLSLNDDIALSTQLEAFKDLKSSLWIDAQPHKDCSALFADGWRTKSIADTITSSGYTHAYHLPSPAPSLGQPSLPLNLLQPSTPSRRASTFWTHNRAGTPLTLFHATPLQQPLFQRNINAASLATLVRERGLTIALTSFDSKPAPGQDPLSAPPLLQPTPDDPEALIPSPTLESRLFDLSHFQEQGTLWNTTVEHLSSWLQLTSTIHIIPLADGRMRIVNPTDRDASNITLILPGGDYTVTPSNPDLTVERRPTGSARNMRDTLAWLSIPAGQHVDLSIEDLQGRRIQPLIPVQWNVQ